MKFKFRIILSRIRLLPNNVRNVDEISIKKELQNMKKFALGKKNQNLHKKKLLRKIEKILRIPNGKNNMKNL